MDIEITLRQAIAAARAGRTAEARHLLETVLDADEHNEQAWIWMSSVVDSDEERVICLENVLTINPQNETARKGLVALGATPEVDVPPSPSIAEEVSQDYPVVSPLASPTGSVEEDVLSGPSTTSDRRPFIAITVVLVLMLICTVISILAFVILSPTG